VTHQIRRRRGVASAGSEAAAAWFEVEKLLSKFGFVRKRWQTPLEFARSIAASEPGLSAANEVARAYYGWRYGGSGPGELARAMGALKAALRMHGERTVRT